MTSLAALSALPLVGATKAALADAPAADPLFAEKVRHWREAVTATERLYRANRQRIAALPYPDIPSALAAPLDLPTTGPTLPPNHKFWTRNELSLIRDGRWQVPVEDDESTVTHWAWYSVSAETRTLASSLLEIVHPMEAEMDAWFAQVVKIEDTTGEPVTEQFERLFAALRHPVQTLGEVCQKIEMTRTADLYASYGSEDDDAREAIFSDILRICGRSSTDAQLAARTDEMEKLLQGDILAFEVTSDSQAPCYRKGDIVFATPDIRIQGW